VRVELVSLAITVTLGMSPRVAVGHGPGAEAAVDVGVAEASGHDTHPAKISERLQDPEAQRFYEAANRYYVEGRYGLAAQELGFAYAVERLPELLVQRALMLDAAGRCAEGIPLLEDFLATAPSRRRAARAQLMIDDCRKRSGLDGVTPAAAPAGSASTGIASTASQREHPPASAESGDAAESAAVGDPWYRDVAGGVLLGSGLAALAAGTGLLIASGPPRRRAATSLLHSDYADDARQATLLQSFGSGALVAGAALTIGAIIRYRGRRAGVEGRPQAGAWLDRRGAGLVLGRRF